VVLLDTSVKISLEGTTQWFFSYGQEEKEKTHSNILLLL